MTSENWDDLAASVRWARRLARVLVDTHWIGGDPNIGQIYGFAAWFPSGGVDAAPRSDGDTREEGGIVADAVLTLRNPSHAAQAIDLDVEGIFDVPAGMLGSLALMASYADQRVQHLVIPAGSALSCELAPFEVLVFEGIPRDLDPTAIAALRSRRQAVSP